MPVDERDRPPQRAKTVHATRVGIALGKGKKSKECSSGYAGASTGTHERARERGARDCIPSVKRIQEHQK